MFPGRRVVKRARQVLLNPPLAVRVALTGPGVVDNVLIPMPDTPPTRRDSLREALLVLVAFSALVGSIWLPAMWTHTLVKGDDLLYYWVFFVSPVRFWNPYVSSGFPTAADPQTMSWYPVMWLFKGLGSWNAFALSPFVLAGCFTYGYVRSVTSSRLAGTVSGVGYALGGYMVGHFGHTSIEHAAAWLPLLIWSFESLALRGRGWWLGVGAFAVASCCLSGHPQIFVYACFLAGGFALWRAFSAEVGSLRYLSLCAAALVLGIAIAAVQLALTAELVPHTVRSTASYAQFTWGSYPVSQWRMMLVPLLYGGGIARPYSGRLYLPELVSYQASLAWMLALAGWASVRPRERGLGVFWAATAGVAILLCLGGNIPVLARLTFQVTPLAVFRAPVRHLLEFSFAMSVLAGLGVAGLKSGALSARAVRRATWIVALVAAAPVAAVLSARGEPAVQGARRLLAEPPVLVSCVLPVVSAVVLLTWLRRREHARVTAALLGTIVLELGGLTLLHHWPASFVERRRLRIPATASKYGGILATTHQRLVTEGGGIPGLRGNLAGVWRVPGVTGYGPLQIARQAKLLGVDPGGTINRATFLPRNQALDVLAARYRLAPEPEQTRTPTLAKVGPGDAVPLVESVSAVAPNISPPLPAPAGARWQRVESLEGVIVRENRRALPRAWSVSEVRQLSAEDVLSTIHTSRFPGGERFDARTTALLEEPPPAMVEPLAATPADVRILRVTDASIQVATSADHASFLVISNLHYPGWTSELDGVPARLYRANYVLQGVWVPAGVHRVVLRYRPTTLTWGGAISLFALALTAVASVALRRFP